MLDAKPTGQARAAKATFSTRPDNDGVPRTRVLVSGIHAKDLDLTGNITAAIAHALWQARGGDATKNWSEAERILEQLGAATPRPAGFAEAARPVAATRQPDGVGDAVAAHQARRGSR